MIRFSLFTLFAAAVILSGCGSTPPPLPSPQLSSTPEPSSSAEFQYINDAKRLIDELKSKISDEDNKNLNYYAPKALSRAKAYLKEAEEEYQDAVNGNYSMLSVFNSDEENALASKKEITQLILKGTTAFDQAVSVKQKANIILADAFALRDYLNSINTRRYFPRDYDTNSSQLDRLVSRIAAGDENRAMREHPSLVANLRALEIKTMLHIKLSSINKNIEKLDKTGADTKLPNLFFTLKKARDTATVTIKNTPRELISIDRAVTATRFQIERMNQFLVQYDQLKKLRAKHYEKYLLNQEQRLYRTSQAINKNDFRNLSFSQQTTSNIEAIAELNLTLGELANSNNSDAEAANQAQAKSDKLKTTITALQAENSVLKSKVEALQERLTQSAVDNTETQPVVEKTEIKEVLPGVDKVMTETNEDQGN